MMHNPPDNDKKSTSPRIGFVVHYPFHVYVLKNIFAQMAAESEFIVDLGAYPVAQSNQLRGEIVALLEKNAFPYRVLSAEDYRHQSYLEHFFAPYAALVSLWERGCISLQCNDIRRKIHVTYGAGKELNVARPGRGVFDLVLSYGERDHALASLFTHSVIVGNPKFDDWFAGSVDMKPIEHITQRLNKTRKTVLYLPTHSDLSSLETLAPRLLALAETYNVIVKLHYFTPREEPERVALLDADKLSICGDETDLLPLLRIADVVISDNSSAIFDAVLADKPVLVTDFLDGDYLDLEHKEVRYYPRGPQSALTYSGSIEQVIKKDGSVLTIAHPDDLPSKITEALRDEAPYPRHRARLRRELFAFNDGKCAARAATAIRDCIADTASQSRPIMYHVVEALKRRLDRLSYGRARSLENALIAYRSILEKRAIEDERGTVFTVILLVRGEYAEALRSLAGQRFPRDRYEVFVVGIDAKPVGPDRTGLARLVGDTSATLGEKVREALSRSSGRVVVFTNDSCTQSSGFLTDLYAAYTRHPDVGGVGGYVRVNREHATVWDADHAVRFAHVANVGRERDFFAKLYEIKNALINQNPAGDLGIMSYRRELIPQDLGWITQPEQLELELKISVMRRQPICFIPRKASRYALFRRSEYLRQEFERSRQYRLARSTIRSRWAYERYGVAGLCRDVAAALIRFRSLSIAYAVLEASAARIFGRVAGAWDIVRRKAVRTFEDRASRGNSHPFVRG